MTQWKNFTSISSVQPMEEEGHDMPDPVIMINDTLSADNPTNGSSFGSPRCDRPITGMVEAQLRKFRHLLENIYKPALIIGCVLSTTLCVFFRVVVLGCGHSHLEWIWLIPTTFRKFESFGESKSAGDPNFSYNRPPRRIESFVELAFSANQIIRIIDSKWISNKLSAFVATILYSFLPVLTGMVSVTAAGFVVGPTSMPCLLSTLKDEKLTEPLMETNEVRWFLLSLFTKARVWN